MDPTPTYLAYPWFDRSAYELARGVMVDGDYWPSDYDTWHDLAKDAMGRLSTDGVVALRQTIDPQAFQDWCESHDRPADSDSRLTFAAILGRNQPSSASD